jgi:PKD repeat protein
MASATVAVGLLFLFAAVTVYHAFKQKTATKAGKITAIVRILGFVLPGIIASIAMPMMIVREPQLMLDVLKPDDGTELVAPVAVTFGADSALQILARRNLRPVTYRWDFDGNGEINEETVVPQVTGLFERTGAYNVILMIELSDGSTRRVGRRLVITKSVFNIKPSEPIIDEPVTFSVEQLIADTSQIREVRWDFNDDGKPEEIRTEPTISHVFVRLGIHTVNAVILLQNQTQQTFRRQIEVREPPPQPFNVKVQTEPKKLLSPPPFGTIFTLVTEESLREVEWNFGDGSEPVKTLDQHRVGHTFERQGNFRVIAEARSKTGETAEVITLVQVVETLRIPDLIFEGSPPVIGNRISGEAPLTVEITPKTNIPLVEFSWEVPEATSVGSTENSLQAIYRHPGTYKLTLLASDPEGKAMRLPITIEVKPPSSVVSFKMDKQSGVAPLKVRFDASQTVIPGKTISGFEWIFGDELTGIIRKQGIAIEEHTFEKPGRYPVKVVVYTTTSETYESISTIVVLPPRLDACFLPSRTSGKMDGKPFGVSFDRSCSTGIVKSIRWSFDDGSESDDDADRVVHVFEEAGVYDVTLTIEDTTGAKSTTMHQITIEP